MLVQREDVGRSQESYQLFKNNEDQLSKNSKETEGIVLRIVGKQGRGQKTKQRIKKKSPSKREIKDEERSQLRKIKLKDK